MINPNALLNEQTKILNLLGPVTPSSAVPDFVDLKGYNRLAILISAKNGTTVTGAAITLTQAKDVSNTSGKTLPFTTIYAATNTGSGGNTDTLTATAVASNSYTLDNTNSLEDFYVIEVAETDLDVNNSFSCVRPNVANTTNQTVSVVGILFPAKFGGQPPLSAIV